MIKHLRLILTGCLVLGTLTSFNSIVHADDGCSDNTSATINVRLSGNLRADISASGPGQLQVKASGPATVWVCTGKECLLQVESEAPAVVNINSNCDPAFNSYNPNNELEIISGVLRIQGLTFFNKNGDNPAGRLVVYLLGSRYEL